MIRWRLYDNNPMREMLEQMLHAAQPAGDGRGEPMPINVHQSESDLFLVAALPGVAPEAVDISCHDGLLTLRARSSVAETEYFHQEIRGVDYFRQVMLPVDCRFDEAEAHLEHGMLEVRIPKQRPRAAERIRIQVNRSAGPTTIEAAKGVGYREVKTTAGKAPPKRGTRTVSKKASAGGAGARRARPGSGPEPAR
jgi:HSP20 family protein